MPCRSIARRCNGRARLRCTARHRATPCDQCAIRARPVRDLFRNVRMSLVGHYAAVYTRSAETATRAALQR
eukprot:4816843-Lingulodinium_polyedra.AAC.1